MKTSAPIYVVDDDDGHAFLVESNLRLSGIANEIVRFHNGFDVLDYMLGNPELTRVPALIVLDVNMPGLSGLRVLEKLRAHPLTLITPVVMLSSSGHPPEIDLCYRSGCNLYLMKPIAYEEFVKVIRLLGQVVQVVELPSSGTPALRSAAF